MSMFERMWPGEARCVSQARRWAGAVAVEAGVPADVVADVELVVSELAANAVLHCGSTFCVQLYVGDNVAVAVVDRGGCGGPEVRSASEGECGGRGLSLAEALASRLVIEGDPAGGHTVTAVLPVAAPVLERGAA